MDNIEKLEKLDDRLRDLEILVARKVSALTKDSERFARGVVRGEDVRKEHTKALANMKPTVERVNQGENLFSQVYRRIDNLESKLDDIRSKQAKKGMIDSFKLFGIAISTIVVSYILIPALTSHMNLKETPRVVIGGMTGHHV
jgi:hypothetical protein